MSDTRETTNTSRFGLVFIVQTVFIILKMTGAGEIATWSWWLVFSPLWISLIAGAVVITLSLLIALVVALVKSK